jgi:hypothetical protein
MKTYTQEETEKINAKNAKLRLALKDVKSTLKKIGYSEKGLVMKTINKALS